MSSDGSTDKARPARPSRGEGRDMASIALGVLLILAVVATVVMIFSDNPVWMRVGTLAALWAAFIGAFLVARYRRQAAAEATRVRDLHTVYELQLEREISARREHELVVEKELRDSIRIETADSVLALRHEIAALREQLGAMGVTMPEDRFAVGGHSAAGQLGAGTLPSVPSERVEPRRRAADQPATPSRESGRADSAGSPVSGFGASAASGAAAGVAGSAASRAAGSAARSSADSAASSAAAASAPTGTPLSGVGPDSTPSTERTEKLSPVDGRGASPDRGVSSDRGASDARGSQPARPSGEVRRPAVRPVGDSGRASRRSAETVTPSSRQPSTPGRPSAPAAPVTPARATGSDEKAAAQPVKPASKEAASTAPAARTTPAARTAPTAPTAESKPKVATHAEPADTASTPRSAADDSSQGEQAAPPSRHGQGSGLSVADLMARLGGDDAPSGGRRRRRAED